MERRDNIAIFDLEFPEDFLSGLINTDFDDICKEALEESAPVMQKSIQSALAGVIKHDGESELVQSVKPQSPKKAKNGAWIVNITFQGDSKNFYSKKKDGTKYRVPNMLKALWKEVGIAGKQVATPFMTSAKNSAKDAVMDRIQKVWEKKVGG